MMRRLTVALLVVISYSSAAGAAAIFDASAIGTLTIVDIINETVPGDVSGLSIFGEAFVDLDETELTGLSSADATGDAGVLGNNPQSLGVGDGLVQSAMVTGEASPVGSASATFLTSGLLDFVNASTTDTYVALLGLDFEVEASASGDFPPADDAVALAAVTLTSASGLIDEFFFAEADALFGPPLDGSSGTGISLELRLGPGESETLTMFVDADGTAESIAAVPEPSTLFLIGLGIGMGGWRAKRAGIRRDS